MKRCGTLLKFLIAWCGIVALGLTVSVFLAAGTICGCSYVIVSLLEKNLRFFLPGAGCLLAVVLGAALFKPYCALLNRLTQLEHGEEDFERNRGEIQ